MIMVLVSNELWLYLYRQIYYSHSIVTMGTVEPLYLMGCPHFRVDLYYIEHILGHLKVSLIQGCPRGRGLD